MKRAVATALLLVGASVGGLATPASACACGAYITNGDTSITRERVAIKWDGTTQDLVMSLDVLGDTPDAALVLPVPSTAELALEENELFDELEARTAPREERITNWWPNLGFLEMIGLVDGDDEATAGAPGGVEVIEQAQLGEYTYAMLAANDPTLLATWLTDNGYQVDESVTAAATPYAEAGWQLVAVRLTAGAESPALEGALQPIRFRFASSEPVYPMRISQLADEPIEVELYVLAANRMDPAFGAVPGDLPELVYADWIDPANIGPTSRVGNWLTEVTFLARYDQRIADPSRISGDYTFARSPADETFQTVIYIDRDLGWLTGGLIAVLGLTLLAVVPTRMYYRARLRAERRARYSQV